MTCSVSVGASTLEATLRLLRRNRLAAPAALELLVLRALSEALCDRERDQPLRDEREQDEEDPDQTQRVPKRVAHCDDRHRHEHTPGSGGAASGGAPHAQ